MDDNLIHVEPSTRERVLRMSRLMGSHDEDVWDRSLDTADAAGLALVMTHLTAAYDAVRAAGCSEAVADAVNGRVIKRAAREVVGSAWERPRLRRDGGPLWSNKYTCGAPWSPAALAVLLDDSGDIRPGKPWSNRLTLEHVVPASTTVKILSAMGHAGASGEDVAQMLRDNVNHVVLVQNGHKASGRRDQPHAKTLSAWAERRLIGHYVEGQRLSEVEWFEAAWSRYVDRTQRDGGAPGVDWELTDLKTVHEGIAERRARTL